MIREVAGGEAACFSHKLRNTSKELVALHWFV